MQTTNHLDRDSLYSAIDVVLERARARDFAGARRLVMQVGRAPNRQGLGMVLAFLVGRDRELYTKVGPTIDAWLNAGPLGVRDVAAGLIAGWARQTGEWPAWVGREDDDDGDELVDDEVLP
jgi:hypothetical protein